MLLARKRGFSYPAALIDDGESTVTWRRCDFNQITSVHISPKRIDYATRKTKELGLGSAFAVGSGETYATSASRHRSLPETRRMWN